ASSTAARRPRARPGRARRRGGGRRRRRRARATAPAAPPGGPRARAAPACRACGGAGPRIPRAGTVTRTTRSHSFPVPAGRLPGGAGRGVRLRPGGGSLTRANVLEENLNRSTEPHQLTVSVNRFTRRRVKRGRRVVRGGL